MLSEDKKVSAIAEYTWQQNYPIKFEYIKVIDGAIKNHELKYWGSFEWVNTIVVASFGAWGAGCLVTSVFPDLKMILKTRHAGKTKQWASVILMNSSTDDFWGGLRKELEWLS